MGAGGSRDRRKSCSRAQARLPAFPAAAADVKDQHGLGPGAGRPGRGQAGFVLSLLYIIKSLSLTLTPLHLPALIN